VTASKRATIQDVARLAGVSRQTVSRATNDKPGIDPSTRQRVLAVAQELGYRPSRFARAMVGQSTVTVGLVIPDILNPYFTEVVAGALEAADSRGWHVVTYSTSSTVSKEQSVAQTVTEHVDACAGFLIDQAAIASIATSGMPFVLLGNEDKDLDVSMVRIDFETGVRQAFDHLVARGHRRIGMIDDRRRTESGRTDERSRLFAVAAAETGLDISPGWIRQATNSIEGGAAAMEQILQTAPEVTAMICYNDILAIGAMRHAKARGLAVPGDRAFIGFDGIPLSALVDPPLTTVFVDRRRIGQACIEQLAAQFTGNPLPDTFIRTELIVRQST
jgi:LacI family transcriptional regulator